jgi:hypothetical protein
MKDMTRLEKAKKNLEEKGIDCKIENDTIYVFIEDIELEISEFEINYQMDEFDDDFLHQ